MEFSVSNPPFAANWIVTNGSWQVASNWSTDPGTGTFGPGVPGAENDVSLNNTNPFTVSFSQSDEIYSLSGTSTATLNINSGTLTVDNGGSFGGTLNVNANGTLSEGAGSTLAIASGTYRGALTGGGDIEFLGGTDTIDTANITVATWELGVTSNGTGTTTVLNKTITYGGNFLEDDYNGNNATLDLNNHDLTLTGTATLDGTISGPGIVAVDGSASELSGNNTLVGGAILTVASGATVTQEGNVALGNASSAGTLSIRSGGIYDITSSSSLGGATLPKAIVNNAGLIDVSGDATATINATLTNTGTGTVTVETGSTLSLFFGNDTLKGTINGGGELFIGPRRRRLTLRRSRSAPSTSRAILSTAATRHSMSI